MFLGLFFFVLMLISCLECSLRGLISFRKQNTASVKHNLFAVPFYFNIFLVMMQSIKGLISQIFYRKSTIKDSTNMSTNTDNNSSLGSIKKESFFGNVLETLDRFLQDESNLIVQFFISLEMMTNISRRYLARAFLTILFSYFIFSNFVLDTITHLLLFLYPSYRTYLLLKIPHLCKTELVDIIK